MSTRERMTWGGKSAAGNPTLPFELAAKRKASAHPQTPDEGITHPAGYDDPVQPDAYENGDTSAWAEDPHPGPYRTSPAPANPMDDGGYRHPAAQPGAPAKNASHNVRAAAELKAAKCLRIASAMLGQSVTEAAESGDKVAVELIEAQALAFMDLPDSHIAASLRRLEASSLDENTLLRKMLAEEEEEEEGSDKEASMLRQMLAEEEEKEDKAPASKEARLRAARKLIAEEEAKEKEEEEVKKEAARIRASRKRLAEEAKEEEKKEEKKEASHKRAEDSKLAEVMSQLASLQAQIASLQGNKSADKSADLDEEAMLAAMLAEEEAAPVASGEDAMLAEMLAEEAPVVAEEAPVSAGKSLAQYLEPMDQDISMDEIEDPMGLFEEPMLDSGDDEILGSLFASTKVAEEEEEKEEEEKPKTAAARTAAAKEAKAQLRPQPKKASTGVQSIGNQVRVASGEQNELARLWASAPDVTKVFNS